MKIQKLGFSVSPWRLTTDDGEEVLVIVPFKHPDIGWTTTSEPICGNTKAECTSRALEALGSFVALKSESVLSGSNQAPSDPGKVTVTTDDHGRCVAVTRTDDEGRILSVIWEAGEMEKPVNARLVEALERIADPRNFHFAGDAQVVAREALSAAEAQQAEPVNERVIDRTWARFCGAFGDGPDAPYPGMIEAFETHYGQSFRDKDWRTEAACWAAAWHKAVLVANPQSEPVRLTDEQIDRAFYPFGASANQLMIARSVGRAVELLALRANGFKVDNQ